MVNVVNAATKVNAAKLVRMVNAVCQVLRALLVRQVQLAHKVHKVRPAILAPMRPRLRLLPPSSNARPPPCNPCSRCAG